MGRPARRAVLALITAASLAVAATSLSQKALAQPAVGVSAVFRKIGPIDAVISRPSAPGPRSHVAIVIMHDESDSLDNLEAPRLAAAGYIVVSTNARTGPDPEDHDTNWDNVLTDLRGVVRFAQAMPGVTKVVLSGHSSGGPLMAAYQNIAENGLKACQGPEKIIKCPDGFADFPKADGVILLDPIFGVGANVLASMDPAITDEAQPRRLDPRLDSLSAANGFDATGAHYGADFKARFFAAEAARNNRIIDLALARQAAIKAGNGQFIDDEPFLVPGATRTPRLWRPDLSLLSHTRAPHLLLKGDGTTATVIVQSVRVPSGTEPTTSRLQGGALNTSVHRFLNTFATRALPGFSVTADGITGVDWASSYSNTPNNVEGISAPLLVMGMTGHYWIVSAEMAYDHAKSPDKTVAFVEGAVHGFTPCTACAQAQGKPAGQYGDTVARTMDFIVQWLDKRF